MHWTQQKKKTPLEVIIVAGKNTAQAKRDESYYVYDIVRALKKELQISKIANPAVNHTGTACSK